MDKQPQLVLALWNGGVHRVVGPFFWMQIERNGDVRVMKELDTPSQVIATCMAPSWGRPGYHILLEDMSTWHEFVVRLARPDDFVQR